MEKKRYYATAIVILYLLPAFVTIIPPGSQYNPTSKIAIDVHKPYIFSGDEPHYLVMVDSIIQDGDLNVTNNYKTAGFLNIKTRYHLFHADNIDYHVSEANPDYSYHPYIIPLLTSLILWPFSPLGLLEQAAVMLSITVTLTGIYYLYKTLEHYDRKNALIITLAFALGTPIWNYSKTFFKEPYLMTALITAYYLYTIKNKNLVPGILIGICFLSRPTFIIFSLLAIKRIKEKRIGQTIEFATPIAASILILLASNHVLYNSPYEHYGRIFTLSAPNAVLPVALVIGFYYFIYLMRGTIKKFLTFFRNNRLQLDLYLALIAVMWPVNNKGLMMLLLSPSEGLIAYAPFIVFALFGFVDLHYEKRDRAPYVIIPVLLYIFLHATVQYDSGYSFSSRFLTPILPLLAFPILCWYGNVGRYGRASFLIILLLSVGINVISVFTYQMLVWTKSLEQIMSALI